MSFGDKSRLLVGPDPKNPAIAAMPCKMPSMAALNAAWCRVVELDTSSLSPQGRNFGPWGETTAMSSNFQSHHYYYELLLIILITIMMSESFGTNRPPKQSLVAPKNRCPMEHSSHRRVERPKKNPWESLVAVLPAHHEPLTTIVAVIAAFHCSKQV